MISLTTRIQRDGGQARLFRQKFSLRVMEGPDAGRELVLARESVTVGSSEHNDLPLADTAVSRHHLRIEVGRQGYIVTDLGSTNGTKVGAWGLGQITVNSAVDLRLGNTVLRISPAAEEVEVALAATDRFGALIGGSPRMRELIAELQQLARRDTTVLLEGETGTGKELIAQELHRHSARADKPFVILDCAAIPPSLIESELFGHLKGAFTGASEARIGVFEEANGGTVFLDEIGELDASMQPQLLRVLETGQVKRLGESTYRRMDVRVIAATNRDLRREVNQRSFRADLFYRLAVFCVRVPPLRERIEDIEALVCAMLPEIAERLGLPDGPPPLDAETLQQLVTHRWPGNVRELRNFVERLAVLADRASFDDALGSTGAPGATVPSSLAGADLPFKEAKAHAMAHFDITYLRRLLERCGGNVAEAARQSSIDRVHLFRLIKKYGLRPG